MAVSPARAAAFDILLEVEQKDAYASELLHAHRRTTLSPTDQGLVTELVMGVLRWRSRLDDAITAYSSIPLRKIDPEVLTALRMAAYQMSFLERIPDRAAINESVELVKRARKSSAAAFTNAVLRKLARENGLELSKTADTTTPSEIAQKFAHPLWLVERWSKEFGDPVAQKICEYDQKAPQTTVRIFNEQAVSELERDGIELAPGALLTSARRVQSGDVTKTVAFQQQRIAIQDEGSQLVALLAGKGSRILDCCAAPGGKTRILASRNPEAKIVAVELHEHRARLLRKLVPVKNVEIITADINRLHAGEQFDCVLADVPCSGTGTLAHNPEIKWRLTPDDLRDLQERQLRILQAAMAQVTPGGRLVYSTCSLEHEENSDVVETALATNPRFALANCRAELDHLFQQNELAWKDPGSLIQGPYLRTIPGVHPCDGFFAAILLRSSS